MTHPDRSQAPSFQLSNNYSLILPEVSSLAENIKFFAFRGIQQEAVKLELIFKSGRWFESKNGVSHFTSQMLSKGTEVRNSFRIAEALDSLGSHLEVNTGFDMVEVSLFTLRKNLMAAMEILFDILTRPSFNENELRLMKDIFIQNLKINNAKTNVVASREIRKSVFGKIHPYGGSVDEAAAGSIQKSDLIEFFDKSYSLHSVFLIGKLSDLELNQVIDQLSFSAKGIDLEDQPIVSRGTSGEFPMEGSVQTSIRLGTRCIRKGNHVKYFDAVMFNHVLGGYFGSRLMKNIREEKGLTYGIYSGMNHFINDSFWVIGAEVNQKNAAEAIQEIKNEIIQLQEKPMPVDELDIARNYFIGSWQSENSTLFAVAEKWKNIHLWNLGDDYYTRMLDHIQRLTPLQVLESANQFKIEDLLEVRVG